MTAPGTACRVPGEAFLTAVEMERSHEAVTQTLAAPLVRCHAFMTAEKPFTTNSKYIKTEVNNHTAFCVNSQLAQSRQV